MDRQFFQGKGCYIQWGVRGRMRDQQERGEIKKKKPPKPKNTKTQHPPTPKTTTTKTQTNNMDPKQ